MNLREAVGPELYTPRNQCVTMLLSALNFFDRPATKRETLGHIYSEYWFDIRAEDREPYPSETIPEPRWGKLIAWARKDAIEGELLVAHRFPDNWHISPVGKVELNRRL